MTIPLAVAPSVLTPGTYLSVDMLAGTASPGSASVKVALVAPKGTGLGTITAETQIMEAVAGEAAVATALGNGTPGHLMAQRLFEEDGLLHVDLVAPAEASGNAATGTITLDDTTPVTADRTMRVRIAGRVVEEQWLVGETDIQAATKLAAKVNANPMTIPVTAANGGGTLAVMTYTFKQKGKIGNDCTISVELIDGAGGAATASGARLTGGTTEPDYSNALAAIAGTEYAFILCAFSGTDVADAGGTSGPGDLLTHIDALKTGSAAKLQQAVVATTNTIAASKVGAAGRNSVDFCQLHANGAQSLPCEFAAAEVGARVRETLIDPAVNRIEQPYKATLYGPLVPVTSALSGAEIESALQAGVTPVTYTAQGVPRPSRPRVTHFLDANSNIDLRVIDVSQVDGSYAIARDLRVAIPQEFSGPNGTGVKLSKDLPAGSEDLPEGVVEERDVKTFVDARMRFWVRRGVVRLDILEQVKADGSFICRVNPSDASQLDIVLPHDIVQPWAKTSLVIQNI